jgi:hypothetical protein
VGSIPTLGSIGGFQYRMVRQLIDRGIADPALDLEADVAAIEASFGALRETDDLVVRVRAREDRARHLSRFAGG